MKTYCTVRALALVVVGLTMFVLCAPGRTDEQAAKARIVGTWRLVSYRYGDRGDLRPAPASVTALKQITPTHFEWVRYDPKTKEVRSTAGGRYTLAGNAYTETVEYGFGKAYEVIKDQEHSFTVTIEGEKLFQKGKLANGLVIEEIWERME
jgi:hypothetical protein